MLYIIVILYRGFYTADKLIQAGCKEMLEM